MSTEILFGTTGVDSSSIMAFMKQTDDDMQQTDDDMPAKISTLDEAAVNILRPTKETEPRLAQLAQLAPFLLSSCLVQWDQIYPKPADDEEGGGGAAAAAVRPRDTPGDWDRMIAIQRSVQRELPEGYDTKMTVVRTDHLQRTVAAASNVPRPTPKPGARTRSKTVADDTGVRSALYTNTLSRHVRSMQIRF